MQQFEDLLFGLGIATFVSRIEIPLTATPAAKIQLGKDQNTDIGMIYGLYVDAGGTMPEDTTKNCLTLANCSKVWLEWKKGQTTFIDKQRLETFVYTAASNIANPKRYTRINVPGNIDMSECMIYNPEKIASETVVLNLLYIHKSDYGRLVEGRKVVPLALFDKKG
jgi:hypothetical protein